MIQVVRGSAEYQLRCRVTGVGNSAEHASGPEPFHGRPQLFMLALEKDEIFPPVALGEFIGSPDPVASAAGK